MVAAVYRRRSTTATRHSGSGGGSAGAQSQLSQGEGGVTAPQQVTGLSQFRVPTHYSETVIHTQHNRKPRVSPCFTALLLHVQSTEGFCKVSNTKGFSWENSRVYYRVVNEIVEYVSFVCSSWYFGFGRHFGSSLTWPSHSVSLFKIPVCIIYFSSLLLHIYFCKLSHCGINKVLCLLLCLLFLVFYCSYYLPFHFGIGSFYW